MELTDKIKQIQAEMNGSFVEREDVIEGIIIAVLARKHVLLLGPPGTAKSLLARDICERIADAVYFERLLTKFSTPEEVIGPVSLSGLKSDKFVRITTGKLPQCHIGFLDEIFKSSSAILNSILTIINERIFHNDGLIEKCNLLSLIGASNEMPTEEGLSALYDRFLLRFVTGYVSDNGISAILSGVTAATKTTITLAELNAIFAEVDAVKVPAKVINAIVKLRRELSEFSISDRRWKESMKLLQAAAWLNGRNTVNFEDIFVLKNSLWQEPQDMARILNVLYTVVYPNRVKILEIYDAVIDSYKEWQKVEKSNKYSVGLETVQKLSKAIEELDGIKTELETEFKSEKIKEIKDLNYKLREELVHLV